VEGYFPEFTLFLGVLRLAGLGDVPLGFIPFFLFW